MIVGEISRSQTPLAGNVEGGAVVSIVSVRR
jgi:hypothetical protein